jgi:hypothetical protein
MTKPLGHPDVIVNAHRQGPPRLSAASRQALATVEDESLRKVLGEILLQSQANQANFDQIREWFPIQPEDVANSILEGGGGGTSKSGVVKVVWGEESFGSGGVEIAHGLGVMPVNVGAIVSARNLEGEFLASPGCWVEAIEVTETLLEIKVWSRVKRPAGEGSWVFWRVE